MVDTRKFLDEFIAEAREHLELVEAGLIDLEKREYDPDPEIVNRVFRGIHSIKGSAGFLGLNRIGELAHIMETQLSMIRAGQIRPESVCVCALLSGVDALKEMAESPLQSGDMDISGVLDEIQAVLTGQLLPKIVDEMDISVRLYDTGGNDTGFEVDRFKLRQIPSGMFLYLLKYDLVEFAREGGRSPVALIRKLTTAGEIIEARIDVDSDDLGDDLSDIPLVYEAVYATFTAPDMVHPETGLSPDRIAILSRDVADCKPGPNREETPGPFGVELDLAGRDGGIVPDSGKNTETVVDSFRKKIGGRGIRVAEEKLDKLVNLVGELVTIQANLSREAGNHKTNLTLRSISEQAERVAGELRDITLNIRMLPIGSMFGKYERLTRDAAIRWNKEVVLVTDGGETELDKKVIEGLGDPLSHIIRNAIGHGIESAEVRQALGKPKHGTVSLSAEHSGGTVVIKIADDGAGIDPDMIRARAAETGALKHGANPSAEELFSFIFMPGFSTADGVDGVSGRGVGLDAARRGIESLGGSIRVESEKGFGTSFTMTVPMTLAIIDGLLVRVETDRFVFPLIAVDECVILAGADLEKARKRNMMDLKGDIIPYINTRELFEIRGKPPGLESVVIVNTAKESVGFGVDSVIGQHKTVIKTLGKMYGDVEGVTGATVLGDGAVALILDVNHLAMSAADRHES